MTPVLALIPDQKMKTGRQVSRPIINPRPGLEGFFCTCTCDRPIASLSRSIHPSMQRKPGNHTAAPHFGAADLPFPRMRRGSTLKVNNLVPFAEYCWLCDCCTIKITEHPRQVVADHFSHPLAVGYYLHAARCESVRNSSRLYTALTGWETPTACKNRNVYRTASPHTPATGPASAPKGAFPEPIVCTGYMGLCTKCRWIWANARAIPDSSQPIQGHSPSQSCDMLYYPWSSARSSPTGRQVCNARSS
jgi:hypothetical protein